MKVGNFRQSRTTSCHQRPVEIYFFLDPLCPECWAMEPTIKKLQVEYGDYFTIRHVMSGKLASFHEQSRKKPERIAETWERTASRSGMSCDGSLWFDDPIFSPSIASIAVKAAELQGKKAGIRYLRKLQECLFLQSQNITHETVLTDCAKQTGLDVFEFREDLFRQGATKAFQCDLQITSEMDVSEVPTLVFFNENIEDEGLKVSGWYTYEVYEDILSSMVSETLTRQEPPTIEQFVERYRFVATKELAVVYDLSAAEVEFEMKKLLLQRKVERIPAKFGTFWRYTETPE
ncbi:ClpXP adapter SpxH family protein [Bacillus fonticola]|uniref:ClpXP adapter SpxH family protein n=1 Tax=Bacillus fonticola TaxID=2728853 RepID=UPI001475EFB3|nr:ClpXP adapter SpxH family protein [Bacillus fonticola]